MNILLIVSIVAFYSTQCLSIQPTKIKTRTTTTKTFEKLGNVQFTTMIIDPTLLFFQAAQFNDVQLIKKFISSNGNVNMLDLNSKSGLMLASQYCSFDVVNALVQAHANLNLKDNLGQTALILASANGCTTVVNQLLNAGANLTIQDNNGETALWRACEQYSNVNTVNALIKAGANVNTPNNNGLTPLDNANINSSPSNDNLKDIKAALKKAGAKATLKLIKN